MTALLAPETVSLSRVREILINTFSAPATVASIMEELEELVDTRDSAVYVAPAPLECEEWTPQQALEFYSAGRHFDVVNGRTRILDTGAVASDALKQLSPEYAQMKGLAPPPRADAADWGHVSRVLTEARQRLQEGGVRHSWMDAACDIAHARSQASAPPPGREQRCNHGFDVLVITTAYESGFGHGHQLDDLPNPYSEGGYEHHAYSIGYEEGERRRRANGSSVNCNQGKHALCTAKECMCRCHTSTKGRDAG
jgi:hypothetical protein